MTGSTESAVEQAALARLRNPLDPLAMMPFICAILHLPEAQRTVFSVL